MSSPQILSTHLSRKAVIYIRQSSPQQVEHHSESRKCQYQLVERAHKLGWPAAACVVIDDDLGISGAQSHNRPGYQRMISMVALREVGIVLGLEVSRLARNSLDWYRLLELAAAFEVLIADEDGLYNPAAFNDRLLLGLKGTISEVELYQIRARMSRGRLSKARRGELRTQLPIGLDWDELAQKPRPAVDESVRHSLELVFDLFRKLRSIRAVLHHLRRERLELPCRRAQGQTRWRRPSYDGLYLIITNPVYAGAFCYGKREKRIDPLTQAVHVRSKPREQWEVFIADHHPGYITLAEFEENRRILQNNSTMRQGAPGKGPALLQGLVYCKHCGHKMRLRYSNDAPYYTCDAAHRRYGEAICNRASARRVDALVEELFLEVVNEQTLELSRSYEDRLREEAAQADRARQEKLKRLSYAATLARRRYEAVDPENRLVAGTLESEWNERLVELDAAQRDYQMWKPTAYELRSTADQMLQVVAQLRRVWHGGRVSDQDKKELMRCLIERVFLEKRGKVIRAEVNWYGGASSELDVPRYLFSAPWLFYRIGELARTHTDAAIARSLNEEGVTTVRGKPWTPRRVMDFRLSNAIASGFTTNKELRTSDSGHITSAEAAKRLGVTQSTIQKWYRLGVLSGKHDGGMAPLWISWEENVALRLTGGAPGDLRMVSIRSLCQSQEKRPDEVLAWAKENNHGIYRLRRGKTLRFYILPKGVSDTPQ